MDSPSPPAALALSAVPEPPEDRTLWPGAAASVLFRLADDAVLAFLGGRNLVFSGERQRIYALDDAAACLACRLEQGVSYRALLSDLTAGGLGPEAAAEALRAWLTDWSHEGVARAALPPRHPSAWQRCTLAVGPASFILLHDDPTLLERVLPAFRHLVVTGDGVDEYGDAVPYRLVAADGLVLIARGDAPAVIVTPSEAAPILKAMLIEDVMARAHGGVALHAATLHSNDGALLLGGSTGAGKSTLTLALLAAGFGYGGDDVALLDAQGRVRGVPFAPAMKAGAARLVSGLAPLPRHRRPDGKWLRYWPVERAEGPEWRPARWLVRLRRRRGVPATLAPMEPTAALAAFMKEAWSPSRTTSPAYFRALRALVAGADCRELVYWDLGEAVRLLARHCAAPPSRRG